MAAVGRAMPPSLRETVPEAEPTSAWQPPSAPEMEARVAMTWPNPAETYRHCTIWSSMTARTATCPPGTA